MALWNNVKCCDLDCETIAFGTRQFAQTDGSLYECSTMAIITPDSEQAETPIIQTVCCESFIYLAINNTITILSCESCNHVLSNNHQASINCLTVSKDWNMLILCFQNGEILGFNVQNNNLMFQAILEQCENNSKTFIKIIQDSDSYIVLASSGMAYRICKKANIENDNEHCFEFEAINDINFQEPYPITASIDKNNTFIFGGRMIKKICDDNVFSLSSLSYSIKKMCNIMGTRYTLCLLKNGSLALLHNVNLYICSLKFEILVNDFTIIKTPEGDMCNLLLSCEDSKRLMLVEFPSMKEIYSIYIKNKIELMDFDGIPMDIKFIEYVDDLTLGKEIRIKALVETCPEYRLERLINRQRFDEAELLVKQFKLNMDKIHKAKAVLELKKYWESVENLSNENFDKLILLLDNITDNNCIADCCLQALQYDSCDIISIEKLLKYVINRIGDESELDSYLKHFQNMLLRLETYNLLNQRLKINWSQFRNEDFMHLCTYLLAKEDSMAAAAVFTRHYYSFCEKITCDSVISFLQKIPAHLHPTQVMPCLRHFIPQFLQTLPSCLAQIVEWCIEKTLSFETLYKSSWPFIGRDFCEAIIELCQINDYDFNYSMQSSSYILENLAKLKNVLEELIILKNKFNITLPIKRYMQNEFLDIALALLKQVPENNINAFLTEFLNPKLIIRNLNLNVLLERHITILLKKLEKDIHWEAKISAFAKFITNETIAMNCIINILKIANLPWSSTIQDLCERGSNSEHPLAYEVKAIHKHSAVDFIQNKYYFEGRPYKNEEILLLVECILVYGKPDALDDIQQLIQSQPHLKTSIWETCVLNCLHMGNYGRCIFIMDELLDHDSRKVCCESIVKICEVILMDRDSLDQEDSTFLQFLTTVKLHAGCCDHIFRDKIAILEKLFILRTKFNVCMTYDDYLSKIGFGTILTNIVQNTINNYQDPGDVFDHIKKFTSIFDIKIESALIELCKQTSDLELVLACVRKLLISSSLFNENTEVLFLVAHIVNLFAKANVNTKVLQLDKNAMYDSADLVYQCIIELMYMYLYNYGIADFDLSLLSFSKWISIGGEGVERFAEINGNSSNKKKHSVVNIYEDISTSFDTRNVRIIIILLICNIFSKPGKSLRLNDIFKDTESNCLSLLQKIPNNRYMTTLRAIQMLFIEKVDYVDQNYMKERISYLVDKILIKMASCKKIDIVGALSILQLSDTPDQVCDKLMTMLSSQPLSQHNIAILAEEFHKTGIDSKHSQDYLNLEFRRKCCSWAIRLKNMNLIIPDSMSNKQKWLSVVLKKLYTIPASYSLLKEFCDDFQQIESLDSILMKQLVYYISNIKQTFSNITNNSLKPEIRVEPTESEITMICVEYTSKITNESKLVKELEQVLSLVSPYGYEIYITIIQILKILKPEEKCYDNWLQVLKFLKGYTRLVSYCQVEHEAWLQHQSDGDIDPLAKYRMPFLCLMEASQVFEIIRHEINVKSCRSWLSIVHALPIEDCQTDINDRLCQYAIKNTMLSMRKQLATEDWCLTMVQKEIREECYEILSLVKNVERYSGLMYFIMNYSKPGADIVEAAKACYDFAPTCANMKLQVEKLQRKYPIYARKHILIMHNLNEPHLMLLLEEPQQLIIALYNHPAVIKSMQTIINDLPDINEVVKQIADIEKLRDRNLNELKVDLLNQWLQSNINQNLNDSITMQNVYQRTIPKNDTISDINWDDDLLRACYVLKSYNKREAAELLGANVIENENTSENASIMYRLRALRCMLQVCGPHILEDVLHINEKQIQELLDNLTIINYLDCVGLSYSLNDYYKCDKKLLVGYLLKNCRNNAMGMSLCVRICQNYEITEKNVWCEIIESLIKLRQIREIQSALSWLRSHPRLSSLPFITKAWQFVIRLPFIEADMKRNPEQEKSCAAALLNLQRCPVAHLIDLIDLAECCIKADRPYMAAALLPLASSDVKKSILKMVYSKSTKVELETNVECLEELGILFVPEVLHILRK